MDRFFFFLNRFATTLLRLTYDFSTSWTRSKLGEDSNQNNVNDEVNRLVKKQLKEQNKRIEF